MKIIRTDNYNRETVSDTLVCENVSEYYGKLILKLLTDWTHPESDDFFRLVPDDHKLYRFEP